MLEATVSNRGIVALNDIVIDKGAISRVIQIDLYINDKYFTTYTADGLLIATPTGSTAYSLSAMGPIIEPNLDVMIINPVSPHALAMRPFITSKDSIIKIKAVSKESVMLMSADGQLNYELKNNDEIIIKMHKQKVSFIKFNDSNYYSVLREKLGWGGFKERTKQ